MASLVRAERAVQNGKICFAFTGLNRYAIQGKFIGRLGNSTLNFTRKTDIGVSREIQRGIPSSIPMNLLIILTSL
jgi:hypothetical protein